MGKDKTGKEEDDKKYLDEEITEEDAKNYNSEVLPESNKSIVWAIIKQIKIGAEVKHVQLPAFVLDNRSLLEKLTDSFIHPDLILGLNKIQDPEQRFLSVVRFYLSGWHNRRKGVKNPLNPVIGETFKCHWNSSESTSSHYIAEQISHHPPHTAFIYYNENHGVALNANITPTYVKFYGNSAQTNIQGLLKLYVYGKDFDDYYEITYPNFLVRGIVFGTLVMEILGKVTIKSEKSGFIAELDFKSKGVFGGKYNGINGKIKKISSLKNKTLYTISGFWDSTINIKSEATKATSVLFDTTTYSTAKIVTPPIVEQEPTDSQKFWEEVAHGITINDENHALDAKRKIEAVQREQEDHRHKNKIEWIPKLFVKEKENFYIHRDWSSIHEQIKAGGKKH